MAIDVNPTAGDDLITGGTADDTVDGLAGNDNISGRDGNDELSPCIAAVHGLVRPASSTSVLLRGC